MVFVIELDGQALPCVLFEMGIVVLCIDEEHVDILGKYKARILHLAREEFGNDIQDVRLFLERR
jgi:hypothetical protein